MTIVCGTDFSEHSRQALRAAGGIARRLGVRLLLVHVIDEYGALLAERGLLDTIFASSRAKLQTQADELRADLGVDVETTMLRGSPDERLLDAAWNARARLVVVGSLGGAKQHRWLLGSVAERVAQSSPVPVLVVRDGAIVEAWVRGDRPLRVMVGVDRTPTSKAALQWARELRAVAGCELVVAHIAWPPGAQQRLGLPGPIALDALDPKAHDLLERELRAWAGDLQGDGDTKFVVSPGWGRVDTHLAQLAAETEADLLVVGTHQRAGLARVWLGSVSRGVLQRASMNVAYVPRDEAVAEEPILPTFRAVLVPTDFSPLANGAIPAAYGLVAPGGVVHLLHVVPRAPVAGDHDPKESLRALIPRGASSREVTTELHVVAERDASTGIWRTAARLGVDAICMATHGRTGALGSILGSQAREVVRHAHRPVLLVPPASP